MKVSIITVVYNAEHTVAGAIESVLSQDYKNIEYIIVDGASTDGTLNVVKKHKQHIAKIISEKDKGIYDAMNKGIAAASGDIIGILNADDFYASKDAISSIVKEFKNAKSDAVYSDLVYVDQLNTDKVVRYWKSSSFSKKMFFNGEFPPHPTLFINRSVYKRLGAFRIDLKLSADFELMLRYLGKNAITTSYMPKVLIAMRMGGASNASVKRIWKSLMECVKAFKINGLFICAPCFLAKTLIFRFLQTLRKLSVHE